MLFYDCKNCGNQISFLHMEYKTDNTPACLECGSNEVCNLHESNNEIEEPLKDIIQEIVKQNPDLIQR